jgi:hypothetical protein
VPSRAAPVYLLELAGGGAEEVAGAAAEPDGFSTVTVVWSLAGWAAAPQAVDAPTSPTVMSTNLQYVSITAEHTRCRAAPEPSTFERPRLRTAHLFFYAPSDVLRSPAVFAR